MSGPSRRALIVGASALGLAAGAGAVIGMLPSGAPKPLLAGDEGEATGYGIDPPLVEPRRGLWSSGLEARARGDLAALIDAVVPGGARAGLVAFFDEWLAAPYPAMRADRALLAPLLAATRGIDALTPAARAARIDAIARGALAAAFRRFSLLAAAAFATTPEGMRAIGFVGNEPRPRFDGPPPEVIARLDAAFAKLDFAR